MKATYNGQAVDLRKWNQATESPVAKVSKFFKRSNCGMDGARLTLLYISFALAALSIVLVIGVGIGYQIEAGARARIVNDQNLKYAELEQKFETAREQIKLELLEEKVKNAKQQNDHLKAYIESLEGMERAVTLTKESNEITKDLVKNYREVIKR